MKDKGIIHINLDNPYHSLMSDVIMPDLEIGFKLPQPKGYYVFVSPIESKRFPRAVDRFIRKDGKPIELCDLDGEQDVLGMILSIGPEAYEGPLFKDLTLDMRPRVGDYVIVNRFAGPLLLWEKKILFIAFPDDRVTNVIENPFE